jgi:HPt (histidine-containing phosphotransfer) domain-containing protein
MADLNHIDRAALDTLLDTVGGDAAFLNELMDAYFDDSPQLLAALHQALESGNTESLRRAAHSFKSNSANFGALALAALCKELEELGKRNELTGAGELIAQAEAEYAAVKTELESQR